MKKILFTTLFFISTILNAQSHYRNNWENTYLECKVKIKGNDNGKVTLIEEKINVVIEKPDFRLRRIKIDGPSWMVFFFAKPNERDKESIQNLSNKSQWKLINESENGNQKLNKSIVINRINGELSILQKVIIGNVIKTIEVLGFCEKLEEKEEKLKF